jgi:hypothetical protein
MKRIKFILTVATCLICINTNAQYSILSDSLQKTTAISLELKLEYQPIQLKINSGKIHQANRPIFLFNQTCMYEQYNVLSMKQSQRVMPFKAYYPAGGVYYSGNNRRRDSFNPHGSKDIGSALLNGFINGILLGNKY